MARAVLDPQGAKIERGRRLLFLLDMDMETGILTSKRYEEFGIKGTTVTWQGARATGRALPGDKVVWLPEKGAANFIERTEHILKTAHLQVFCQEVVEQIAIGGRRAVKTCRK